MGRRCGGDEGSILGEHREDASPAGPPTDGMYGVDATRDALLPECGNGADHDLRHGGLGL